MHVHSLHPLSMLPLLQSWLLCPSQASPSTCSGLTMCACVRACVRMCVLPFLSCVCLYLSSLFHTLLTCTWATSDGVCVCVCVCRAASTPPLPLRVKLATPSTLRTPWYTHTHIHTRTHTHTNRPSQRYRAAGNSGEVRGQL